MASLQPLELAAYFSVWISSILYLMYRGHVAGSNVVVSYRGLLTDGWRWIGRGRDATDNEWDVFSSLLLRWIPFVATYLLVSPIFRQRTHGLTLFSIAISSTWLLSEFGFALTAVIFLQPIALLTIKRFSSLNFIWLLCLVCLLVTHEWPVQFHVIQRKLFHNDGELRNRFTVVLTWNLLRSISYLYDVENSRISKTGILSILHFCLYLPLLPMGPLMRYQDFKQSIAQPSDGIDQSVLKTVCFVWRYILWWLFYEISLHLFYHNIIRFLPSEIEKMDEWAVAGLACSFSVFFMVKYVVFYGLPTCLARLDGILAPDPPKCVFRIRLSSQLWRLFDRGIYEFMLVYLYIPSQGAKPSFIAKLWGSALTFGFIFVWHGVSSEVFVWCAWNFISVSVENGVRLLTTRPFFVSMKDRISKANRIRIQALMSTPMMLMMFLSNVYFLTKSVDVGNIFVLKAWECVTNNFITVLTILYCGCSISLAMDRLKC